MIHKKAFRKKSLKLYTSPDEDKLQSNVVDYLSSSCHKSRYSADIFSNHENPLSLMTSLNAEWGKTKVSKKNSLKESELESIDEEKERFPLLDLNEVAYGKNIIKEDIVRLKKVLIRQQEHGDNLKKIKNLCQIIEAQGKILSQNHKNKNE